MPILVGDAAAVVFAGIRSIVSILNVGHRPAPGLIEVGRYLWVKKFPGPSNTTKQLTDIRRTTSGDSEDERMKGVRDMLSLLDPSQI